MPMNFASPYQPMNFGQGNPLFGGQQPPQGMPQGMGAMPPQGMPQAPQMASQPPMPPSPSQQMGLNPGPLGPQQSDLQSPAMPKLKQGGMFGSGRSAGDLISSFILNYAAGMGNPIGTNYMQGQSRERQMQLEEAQYQNHQQSELQRQMQMYQFQMQNPNGEMDQAIRQAGLDPHSPQAQAMYAQRAQTLAAPMQAFDYQGPDGTVTKQFFRPGPMSPVGGPAGAPPPMSEADLIKLGAKPGGPTPQGSATFRY